MKLLLNELSSIENNINNLIINLNLNSMKLRKLKLNEISKSELDDREMCRILGGGTAGCCQCGCHYAGQPGGSSYGANGGANNEHGYVSDSGAQPCCTPSSSTHRSCSTNMCCS